jgi:hypothetical protein
MGSKPSALENLRCCVSIVFLCFLGASRSLGIVRVSKDVTFHPSPADDQVVMQSDSM